MTTIPTITEIRDMLISAFETQFGITVTRGQRVFLYALAVVLAGFFKLNYLQLGKVQQNLAPDKADKDTLIRYGDLRLGRGPRPATAGEFTISLTVNTTGTIPARTQFQSDETATNPGILYVLDNDFAVSGTVPALYDIQVRALTPGMAGKLYPGDSLTATSPIAIASPNAFYDSEVVAPIDAETIEEYRQKVIQSYRLEPQGGAASDYRLWGLDAPGVKQIYPYAVSGFAGKVKVYVEATEDDSIDGAGTPSSTILGDVEDCIELNPDTTLPLAERGRKPLATVVEVAPVNVLPVEFIMENYVGRTFDVDNTIRQALRDYLSGIRPFIASADDPATRNDVVSRAGANKAVIDALPLSVYTDIKLEVDGSLVSTYQFDNGAIPTLFAVTFTP